MTDVFIILFYLLAYLFAIFKFKSALYIFVLFLSIRNITEDQIFGLISPNVLFSFILFYHFVERGYFQKIIKYFSSHKLRPLSIFLLVFIVTLFFITIKQRILLSEYLDAEVNTLWIFSRTITSFFYFINILIIINICFLYESYRRTTYNALIFSAVLVVLSLYFAPYLSSIGINLREEIEYGVKGLHEIGRIAGLYHGGDTNSVSAFLNLIIAIILVGHAANRKSLSFSSVLIVVFLATGVLLTASRMGFATLLFIAVYYIFIVNIRTYRFTTKTIANIFLFSIAIVAIAYLLHYYDRFGWVLARITDQGLTEEVMLTGPRYIRWIGFIEHTMSKFTWFLFGSDEIYYAFIHGVYRDPHNFYVKIFYINGFINIFLYINAFIYLVYSLKKMKLLTLSLPLISVILISMIIISQTHIIYIFIIYLGLLIQHQVPDKAPKVKKNNHNKEVDLKFS